MKQKFKFINIDRFVYLNDNKTAICIDFTLKLLGITLYHKLNSNALPIDVDAVLKDTPKGKVGFNTP